MALRSWLLVAALIGISPSQMSLAQAAQSEGGSVGDLVEQLTADDAELRRQAAYVLGNRREATAAIVDALAKASDERAQEVRWYAVEALGKIGPPARSATEMIVKGYSDPANDRFFRRAAVRALGQIGSDSANVKSTITVALKQEEDAVLRVEAFVAAHALKLRDASELTAGLAAALKSEAATSSQKDNARRAVCWHLGAALKNEYPQLNGTLCDVLIGDDVATAAAGWALSQRGTAAMEVLLERLVSAEVQQNTASQQRVLMAIKNWLRAKRGDAADTKFIEETVLSKLLAAANTVRSRPELAGVLHTAGPSGLPTLLKAWPEATAAQRTCIAEVLHQFAESPDSDFAMFDRQEVTAARGELATLLEQIEIAKAAPAAWKLLAKLTAVAPKSGGPRVSDAKLRAALTSPSAVVRRYAAELLRRK